MSRKWKVKKGSVRTRRTIGKTGTPKTTHPMTTKAEELPGPGPRELLAHVSVQAGGTFTTNDYQSVRVSIDVNLPVAIDEPFREGEEFDRSVIDAAVLKAMEIASDHYERESQEIREVMGIKGD